ncbi:MAG TPA: FixH family protein [Pyrinomonadaceae bacterium]|nr:FixH family protein [Pyrinomonadaceae bacterium]
MRRAISFALIVAALALAPACGAGGSKEIKSGKVGDMTVTLASADGVLRNGDSELTVTFRDSSGKPADVGSASLNFFMPAMGSMPVMNNPATLTTTSEPGVYRAAVKLEMAGEWQAQIAYEGPRGAGKGSFAVTAQ